MLSMLLHFYAVHLKANVIGKKAVAGAIPCYLGVTEEPQDRQGQLHRVVHIIRSLADHIYIYIYIYICIPRPDLAQSSKLIQTIRWPRCDI